MRVPHTSSHVVCLSTCLFLIEKEPNYSTHTQCPLRIQQHPCRLRYGSDYLCTFSKVKYDHHLLYLIISPSRLFDSLKYHNLHPEYIHERLKQLGNNYELRVLLVVVDIVSHSHNVLVKFNDIRKLQLQQLIKLIKLF